MKKKTKKPRNKAGYKVKDRLCRLCGAWIPKDKSLNLHHISYDQDVVIPLHYTCHNIVHGRMKFNCPYDRKYNKDHAPYYRALKVLRMYMQYPKILEEMQTKWGEV